MFLIQTVDPAEADGKVAELYGTFPAHIGVPLPMRLLSASPGILERSAETIRYYMTHPRLSPGLLASIRYAVASRTGHTACVELNRGILEKMGLSEAELAELARFSCQRAELDDEESAMLAFVLKAFDTPQSVVPGDVEELRKIGYTDGDILDALYHATTMLAGSVLFKAFVRQ